MSGSSALDLTVLLRRSMQGDGEAHEAVWTYIHDQLKVMARSCLARESGPRPLDATELVHEAWIKLDSLRLEPRDRLHFMGLAARAMRQVLVDQARARRRDKRGGGLAPVTLRTQHGGQQAGVAFELLDLERALEELEGLDKRKASAVELSYFGGLTDEEVAESLAVSTATVKRDLRMARAWLASALG